MKGARHGTRQALRLAEAFARIEDGAMRRVLVQMVDMLAPPPR